MCSFLCLLKALRLARQTREGHLQWHCLAHPLDLIRRTKWKKVRNAPYSIVENHLTTVIEFGIRNLIPPHVFGFQEFAVPRPKARTGTGMAWGFQEIMCIIWKVKRTGLAKQKKRVKSAAKIDKSLLHRAASVHRRNFWGHLQLLWRGV